MLCRHAHPNSSSVCEDRHGDEGQLQNCYASLKERLAAVRMFYTLMIGHCYLLWLVGATGESRGTSALPGWRIPTSFVRFSISALIATMRVLPDIDSAATCGLSMNGYKTPAASGNAITL
jgi:hypothetical protein